MLFFGQTYLKIPQMAHWRLQPISPGGIVSWYVLLGVSESLLLRAVITPICVFSSLGLKSPSPHLALPSGPLHWFSCCSKDLLLEVEASAPAAE